MTLFKSWVLIVVLACLLVGVAITIVTGFAVPRESYINTTFGDRDWIESTEADRSPFGYGFNGISMGVFVLDAVAWGLLLALLAVPFLFLVLMASSLERKPPRKSSAAPD